MSCSVDETKHIKDRQCVACDNTQKHFRVGGTAGQCIGCDPCQELQIELENVDFESLSTETRQYTKNTGYKVLKIKATCVDLRRRQLQIEHGTLKVINHDVCRDPVKPWGEPLPKWHFVDRNYECKKTACEKKCSGFPFMYSNGCGLSVWVSKDTNPPELLSSLSLPITPADWRVVTEGVCKYCTFCARDSYNAGCNKGYGGNPGPEGQCLPCLQQCEPNHFLHHPDKDAGCHDPAETKRATDGSGNWMTKQNYECKRCLTWVHEHGNIYTVTACRRNTHYTHTSSDLKIKDNVVPPMPDGDKPYESGPLRKTFRSFYNDKRANCLPGFYFNSKLPNCNLLPQGEAFKLPAEYGTDVIGYDDYNPGCCSVCTSCASPLEFKDISIWKSCTGDTMQDTQNHCMEKCLINDSGFLCFFNLYDKS